MVGSLVVAWSPRLASLVKTRRCCRWLCRVDCHNMKNQMRLAMTTVCSPSPAVATAASREQTSSRVYCNVWLSWQPACSPLSKQQRNENILPSAHSSSLHFLSPSTNPLFCFFLTGSVTPWPAGVRGCHSSRLGCGCGHGAAGLGHSQCYALGLSGETNSCFSVFPLVFCLPKLGRCPTLIAAQTAEPDGYQRLNGS